MGLATLPAENKIGVEILMGVSGKQYCPRCGEWKALKQFYHNNRDGYSQLCRKCTKSISRSVSAELPKPNLADLAKAVLLAENRTIEPLNINTHLNDEEFIRKTIDLREEQEEKRRQLKATYNKPDAKDEILNSLSKSPWLNPIEQADIYLKLNEDFGMPYGKIAEAINCNAGTIARYIRLTKGLPVDVKNLMREGKITVSQGESLLSYTDDQVVLNRKVEQAMKGATVRELRVNEGEISSITANDKSNEKEQIAKPAKLDKKLLLSLLKGERDCVKEEIDSLQVMFDAMDMTITYLEDIW